jgi:flagellum-specific peptidoglycan hydrolase FlgJ
MPIMNILRNKNGEVIWKSEEPYSSIELYNNMDRSKAIEDRQRRKRNIVSWCCLGFVTVGALVLLFGFAPKKKWKPNGSKVQIEYVKRFAKIAQQESDKFGIPASITLAQGVLESKAGQSTLATRNNNHFGIKCFSHSCKKGHCSNFTDDSHKDFFKIYQSPWESYREHSKFLQKPHYKTLYGSKDVFSWCIGLEKIGYATSPTYAEDLMHVIDELDLKHFDQ